MQLLGIQNRHAIVNRPSERGEGKLKAIVILAIVVYVIFVAVKLVPLVGWKIGAIGWDGHDCLCSTGVSPVFSNYTKTRAGCPCYCLL